VSAPMSHEKFRLDRIAGRPDRSYGIVIRPTTLLRCDCIGGETRDDLAGLGATRKRRYHDDLSGSTTPRPSELATFMEPTMTNSEEK
jgi:hypothetical protein